MLSAEVACVLRLCRKLLLAKALICGRRRAAESSSRRALDITGAKAVEVRVRADGTVLWVNVDGICALRVCQVQVLVVEDKRNGPPPDEGPWFMEDGP
jgi:hypothetical protein